MTHEELVEAVALFCAGSTAGGQRMRAEKVLAIAAAGGCYALGAAFLLTPGLRYREYVPAEVPRLWPWDARWWKLNGRDPRRGLVKAGALILAEIERLDRAGAKETRG